MLSKGRIQDVRKAHQQGQDIREGENIFREWTAVETKMKSARLGKSEMKLTPAWRKEKAV